MSINSGSTVDFKSNVYPVSSDQVLCDEKFLDSLRDPVAVREFKRRAYRYYPSKLQNEILAKGVGLKCSFAEEGDFSWGTILEDGRARVVCKCENYACEQFPSCRPGVEIPCIEESPAEATGSEFLPQVPKAKTGAIEENEIASDDSIMAPELERCVPFLSHDGEERKPDGFHAGLDETKTEVQDRVRERFDSQEDSNPFDECDREVDDGFESPLSLAASPASPQCVEGRYDVYQAAVVCADPSRRVYVNAGPGTGKTHTLIEKLKFMMEELHVDPDSITVLSFTRAAVSVVQDRLKKAAVAGQIHALWQDVDITTFDKLCTRVLYFVAQEAEDKNEEKRIARLSYDQRIVAATQLMKNSPSLLEGCSHLIVDEVQDLVGPRADLVLAMLKTLPPSCGFTIFGDRCQSVYDYQVKEGGTTSGEFFDEVMGRLRPDEVYLEKNYRLKPSYPLNLNPMRQALLCGDTAAASTHIAESAIRLGMPQSPLRKLDGKAIDDMRQQGSVGILTRKNDEALEVESLLWKFGIPAFQGRSDAGEAVSRYVADVFTRCSGETVDEHEFRLLCERSDSYGDGRVWRALISLEGLRLEGDRLRVSDALSALQGAVLSSELAAQRDDRSGVFVSTIHFSKGREFDTVWMLAENFKDFVNADEPEEKRVAYVGLTRAMSDVSLQCLDEHFLIGGKQSFYTCKMFDRDRYFRKKSGHGRRTSKPRVVNIEVRNSIDIDFESFRLSEKVQEFLSSGDAEGTQIRFILKGSGARARYEIVLHDDEEMVLGRVSHNFIDDYRKCVDYHNREAVVLPDAFDEIYIDRVVSCIGRRVPDVTYDKEFGEMAVWYGFTVGGYAHRDDSQGY